MTTALDMCRAARAAWERTQPQLYLEVDDLTRLPDAETTAAPECPPHTHPVAALAEQEDGQYALDLEVAA